MINKIIRDVVNLLIYGGFFIGLCASCITALTLEANGNVDANLSYTVWIGFATAALYCGHRVIGLHKVAHIQSSERFNVIRRYRTHIWTYFVVWTVLTIALFFKYIPMNLFLWLIPGGVIGVGYVLPFMSGKKRLRDLGWTKIIMIGFSWAWLTAFIPAWQVAGEPLAPALLQGIQRLCFIIAITIPFEIRDIVVDRSIGLVTMPEKLGKRRTMAIAWILCIIMVITGNLVGFHYYNIPYALTSLMVAITTIIINRLSYHKTDDYFFGGLTDGLMVIALLLYTLIAYLL